jgi:uncharacterized alpha-E superfamily protein
LLDVYYHLREDGDSGEEEVWRRMAEAIGAAAQYEKKFGSFRELEVVYYLLLEPGEDRSVFSCIRRAREHLRAIRNELPAELWHLLNGFYLSIKAVKPADIEEESPQRLFQRLKEGLAAFWGTAGSVMLRDQSWYMLEAGRSLERADHTIRQLVSVSETVAVRRSAGFGFLMAMLKAAGGAEAYFRQGIERVTLEEVARFLLVQNRFPRSVKFALHAAACHIRSLSQPAMPAGGSSSGQANAGFPVPSRRKVARLLRMAEEIERELGLLEDGKITEDRLKDIFGRFGRCIRRLEESLSIAFFSSGRAYSE